jgi:DNA-directed RNA polymerase subunit RPC12/RpoP
MAIRWRCSSCSKQLSIGARKAGSEVRCPACNQALIVPAETSQAPPPLIVLAETSETPLQTTIEAVASAPTTKARSARPITVGMALTAGVAFAAGAALVWLVAVRPADRAALPAAEQPPVASLSAPAPSQQAPVELVRVQAPSPPGDVAQKAEPRALAKQVKTAVIDDLPPAQPVVQGPAEPAAVKNVEVPARVDQTPKVVGDGARAVPPKQTEPEDVLTTAFNLREQLAQVPELDFYAHVDKLRQEASAKAGSDARNRLANEKGGANISPPEFAARVNAVLLKEARAAGLPLKMGSACQASAAAALEMDSVSSSLRSILVPGSARRGTKGATLNPELSHAQHRTHRLFGRDAPLLPRREHLLQPPGRFSVWTVTARRVPRLSPSSTAQTMTVICGFLGFPLGSWASFGSSLVNA